MRPTQATSYTAIDGIGLVLVLTPLAKFIGLATLRAQGPLIDCSDNPRTSTFEPIMHVSPNQDLVPAPEQATSTFDTLQHVMRFIRAARYRKQYIFASLVVTCLLGGVYYLTATRIYQATASLLVTTTGADVLSASNPNAGGQDVHMSTYERLFSSAVVLDRAIELLNAMPVEMRTDFADRPRDQWQKVLANNLSVKSVNRTEIIEIGYKSKSPEAAVAVVDAVVRSYLEFMEQHHRDVSVEILAILDNERHEVETQLVDKQRDLLTLKHEMRDLGLREDSHVVHPSVQRVIELNRVIVEVQRERLQAEASLAAVRVAVREGSDLRQHLAALDPYVSRNLMMSTMGLDTQSAATINLVERKLIDDQSRLESLSSHYGPRHPQVVEVRQRIQQAQEYVTGFRQRQNSKLADMQGEKLGSMLTLMLEQRLNEVQTQEQQLLEEYQRSETEAVARNDRMAELQVAENELSRMRSLHETLLDRISNVDINQNQATTRVAVVSQPTLPTSPISPRLTMVAAFCLFVGLGVGMAIVYVLDLLDDRFRTPEELKEQLGVPVLAMVRRFDSLEGVGTPPIQTHVEPEAVESEAFRTLRAALAFSGQDLERMAITSSQPGDGKTTVISNLGVAYAQAGKRTLLIDADLRKPGLTKLLSLRGAEGLSNVLRSTEDIGTIANRLITNPGVENLFVLPCGPRPSDPAELISGERMQQFVAWCEQNFDQVFIDCPPILAASDAALVARLMDGIMLVVQPEKNHRRIVMRAVEQLHAMQVNLVGVVANAISDTDSTYGYGYGYGYGQGYGLDEDDDMVDESSELPGTVELQPRRAA